jgi:two-component system response regulator HydG
MNDRAGLFEAADRGTILLDEIGEISLPMQVKLLRALQQREVRRVGENRERRFDARVIAATNRNLMADVAAGRFRRDLLYRLKVIELEIPPLRERREDLRALAEKLLARIAREMRREIVGYSDEAIEWILQYPWPGNVRELENALARACALTLTERIHLVDLPEEIRGPAAYLS